MPRRCDGRWVRSASSTAAPAALRLLTFLRSFSIPSRSCRIIIYINPSSNLRRRTRAPHRRIAWRDLKRTDHMKRALITGITGQDGSYLAELLLSKGYEVHGIIRRASTFNTSRIDHIYSDPHLSKTALRLHYGDLSDASAMARLIDKIAPDEIYNLAAQSHVRVSFDS